MFKIVHGAFIIVMSLLVGLLGVEYSHLRQSTNRIVEIQEEYQTYIIAFRKILRDYQRLKEGEEETASEEDDEKKKEPQFLVVNREPEYLKASMVRYLKQQRMSPTLARIYDSPEVVSTEPRISRKRHRGMRRRAQHTTPLLMSQLTRHRALLRGRTLVHDISFAWPIDRSHFWLSSFYGSRRKPDRTWGFHYGIDMAAIKGTTVKAVAPGIVVEAGANKGYGNTIVLMHNNKYRTRYAHLHKIYVHHGQRIEQGQRIGAVGDTGLVRKRGKYASHLHFEVYVFGKRVNPLYFFM